MTVISLYLGNVYVCPVKIMYKLSSFEADYIFEIEIIANWMYECVFFLLESCSFFFFFLFI